MKKLLIPLLLCLLFSYAAASESCDICGREIKEKYFIFRVETRDYTVCSYCADNLGRCMLCGMPVSGTRKTDTGVLCRDCRLRAEKCDVCGATITGRYFTNEKGRIFCPECHESAPRCAFCNDILLPGEWSHKDGENVCHACLKDRPRCAGCNRLIKGQYSVYTGFDGVYCESCKDSTPACISCLRPCGPNPIKLKNGHTLCTDCSKTAVSDQHNLRSIIVEVSGYMERNLLMSIRTDIEFKMVDSVGQSRKPDHYREAGRFIRYGDEFTIEILKGLSRPICIETVAHECAHAWQSENWPSLYDYELVEGFAQWIAGRVLTGMGYPEMVERLHHRDDIYGRGYRRLMVLEEKRGFSGVFRYLEKYGPAR